MEESSTKTELKSEEDFPKSNDHPAENKTAKDDQINNDGIKNPIDNNDGIKNPIDNDAISTPKTSTLTDENIIDTSYQTQSSSQPTTQQLLSDQISNSLALSNADHQGTMITTTDSLSQPMNADKFDNFADDHDADKSNKFDPSIAGNSFDNDPNFFGRMGMFGDSEAMPEMNQSGISGYGFPDYTKSTNPSNTVYPMNYGTENYGYDMNPNQIGYGAIGMNYNEMGLMPQPNDYSADMTYEKTMRPAKMSDEELQKEMLVRSLHYADNDRVGNIARLVNYLVDRGNGESDLSSHSGDEDVPSTRREYKYLEVILINCDQQRKPLLDWLETWKNASKETNSAEIFELAENNLIKIRIFNNSAEPSGVIDQLNSVKIKCARYYCFSRGENWGGWEYFEGGFMQKQESYNAEQQPPRFWRRLCWLENAGISGESDKLNPATLAPMQVCSVLGTTEQMICVDCGEDEDKCRVEHGHFNGQFKSKDLYNRYVALMSDE